MLEKLQQKNVSCVKDLVGESTGAGDFLMNSCAGILPTAMACTLLVQCRKFVGRDLDSDVLNAAEPDLLSTFSLQVLKPISDVTAPEKVRAGAQALRE